MLRRFLDTLPGGNGGLTRNPSGVLGDVAEFSVHASVGLPSLLCLRITLSGRCPPTAKKLVQLRLVALSLGNPYFLSLPI